MLPPAAAAAAAAAKSEKGLLLSLAFVQLLVLDEMDKILSMGNDYELQTIRNACTGLGAGTDKRTIQVLLFSATIPPALAKAAAQWVHQPEQIKVSSSTNNGVVAAATQSKSQAKGTGGSADTADQDESEATDFLAAAADGNTEDELTVAASIEQIVHVCAEHKKPKKLLTFIGKIRKDEKEKGSRSKARILIFCNRIKSVKFVEATLRKDNHFCKQMSSAMSQQQRERTLAEFRCGKLPILVATDVAGRGLDVKGLEYVVNYDFPSRLEVYVHRAGRTGRQGAAGHAYSFFGRHLQVLAPGLVKLLENSNQWVDPNLRGLLPAANKGKGGKGEKMQAGAQADTSDDGSSESDSGSDGEEGGAGAGSDHDSDGLENWSDSDD